MPIPAETPKASKIGGSVMLVVTSPDRYEKVLGDLREHGGSCCGKHRLKQAQRAFAHTAEYDSLIANYLATSAGIDSGSTWISFCWPAGLSRLVMSYLNA